MTDKTQIVNEPNLYVNGLELSWATVATLSVADGKCRDSSDKIDMDYDAATTINCAVNGANGLDTGSLANSTWYAVYAIADSSKYNDDAFIVSSSFTAPYLPSGYDIVRIIGYALTNGSAEILKFYTAGKGKERYYLFDSQINIITGGASATFVEIDLSTSLPPVNLLRASIEVSLTPNTAGNLLRLRPVGSLATSVTSMSAPVVALSQVVPVTMLVLLDAGVPKVEYKVSEATDSVNMYMNSFEYSI